MKGVELPINVLVIVVIAVIVLLGVVAVFFTGWTPYASSAGVDAVKNDACRKLSYDCSKDPSTIEITNFDVDSDGDIDTDDNLLTLCSTYYDTATVEECKRLCGCGGGSTILGGGPSTPICTSCNFQFFECDTDCRVGSPGDWTYYQELVCMCDPPGCSGTCSGGYADGDTPCSQDVGAGIICTP